MTAAPQRVRVLDADPGLAQRLDPETAAVARRHAIADVMTVEPGEWRPHAHDYENGADLGLLVLDGLIVRDVQLGGRIGSELLTPGDLLRPTDHDGEHAPVPFAVVWEVLEPARLAVLDRRFSLVIGRWPEITAALVHRAVSRSHWLAVRLAIERLPRVDMRICVLLWHLADRHGKVTPDGVVVPFRLTHEMLGNIVGARRPSVTTALGELAERGAVEHREDRRFVLRGGPPEVLTRAD